MARSVRLIQELSSGALLSQGIVAVTGFVILFVLFELLERVARAATGAQVMAGGA